MYAYGPDNASGSVSRPRAGEEASNVGFTVSLRGAPSASKRGLRRTVSMEHVDTALLL